MPGMKCAINTSRSQSVRFRQTLYIFIKKNCECALQASCKRDRLGSLKICNTLQRITSELHLYNSKKDVFWFFIHLVVVNHYLLYSVQLFWCTKIFSVSKIFSWVKLCSNFSSHWKFFTSKKLWIVRQIRCSLVVLHHFAIC